MVLDVVRWLVVGCVTLAVAATRNSSDRSTVLSTYQLSSLTLPQPKCPPCFNCLLPAFTCGQYGNCDPYNGQCQCPPGWGGIDCLTPQCDSLADGDHRKLREGSECECKEGWGGINCNVCKTDEACHEFPLRTAPELRSARAQALLRPSTSSSSLGGLGLGSALSLGITNEGPVLGDDDDEGVANMTCYKGGETVFENHQMCNVTNRKILDMLPDRPPQVTFSCIKEDKTCSFQFWTAQVESFYCALDGCVSETKVGYDNVNTTSYGCEKIRCSCIKDRFICGEDGSVDISDFLTEEIRGPATFSCITNSPSSSGSSGASCKFEEPAMNGLINDIFGDGYITLMCEGGECLHYSMVPGYVRPPKPDNTFWVALSAASAGLFVILVSAGLWYVGRTRSGSDFGKIRLPEDEQARLMTDHVPASLHFSDISYTLNSRPILQSITGSVKPGQVLAIMGASGAGKSTFLDILARKAKRGQVRGTTLVNGREVGDEEFRRVCGFVDQEDCLMGGLSVYESVLYSALLRLPREMSLEAKKFRTLETMQELGILGIRDMRIGDSGHRSISGGEKRRVSIACELVTSPSILFLDEPTSGLDAYNAYNVIDSLVSLARNYNRTVVFTIHQPRSNIVAMFDQLVLLAQGRCVYSGEVAKCQEYFEGRGWRCPGGFNIADYLIDLTMSNGGESKSLESPAGEFTSPPPEINTSDNLSDEERGLLRHIAPPPIQTTLPLDETELQTRPNTAHSITSSIKHKTSQLFEAVASSASSSRGARTSGEELKGHLKELVEAYEASEIALGIREEIEEVKRAQLSGVDGNGELRDVEVESTLLRGRKRASWATQFRILSGRAFKNLYRDPALLTAHYLSSIGLALICGLFYRNVSNDIPGFQNRLGIFFFTLALFGFSCLSSLSLFANERLLFMRERANGYYSSFTYFSSKVLFDILPLRVVPPLLFGGIVYSLVGLVPTVAAFWKFLLTLVLFNLTTASVILLLSIACESTSVASLIGTLVMLFNLLFTGLLINRESVPASMQWLHTVSFFHAAFEALAVNELRYLQLKQMKYGVELDVPAATILSIFGLRAQSFWWPNISLLGVFFVLFTTASYFVLHFYVREKR
ncbi:hypothetical protein JAAARDRAFT_39890 [Jaapia argillacea MUCL 33604]|uniref:ABC transporter domain-containing protein n=1 Tax=Jaapia argillacea MUCL 33604 TaxID=933084 RepID=A0A067PCZ4_9AGAM|nr:hypothetical protein JAAARDRAFT_39890 [Jaapia argillacea MUCL 33604]